MAVDTSCQRDDSTCVKNVVDSYSGPGNILISWEHNALTDIVEALGDNNAPSYPSDQYVQNSQAKFIDLSTDGFEALTTVHRHKVSCPLFSFVPC